MIDEACSRRSSSSRRIVRASAIFAASPNCATASSSDAAGISKLSGAGRREHLSLADVERGARRVVGARSRYGCQNLERADAPVREGFFAVEPGGVHRDFGVVQLVCHARSSFNGAAVVAASGIG
jgi:hypothetical protein